MREAEENKITFGIPAFINNQLMNIGTEMRLLRIEKKYPDGKLDVRTQGVGLFRIAQFYAEAPGKLYAGADIERITQSGIGDVELNARILDQLAELFQTLQINKPLPGGASEFRMYDVAHHLGMNIEQEYHLLTLTSERERQEFAAAHLEHLLPIAKEMEKLRVKAQMNGHFKHIIPPSI